VPLPADKIIAKLPELLTTRSVDTLAANKFASTILTTDTRPKTASARFRAGNKTVRLLGIAKGSGMIHPQLATMLVYLMTDIAASPRELKRLLKIACADSFECISVDGDTSTNDTVLLLASGKSGVSLPNADKPFAKALSTICQSLAEQIVQDGEGMQHVIRLSIEEAKNRNEALQIARAIAHSLLVKTAWAGADPNWGRMLAAIGRSGMRVNPEKVSIHIGGQTVCKRGACHPFDQTKAHQHLSQPDCSIRVRLGRGAANINFITTDLTAEYVRINADYST
jgi:glutamate N-acetyltransferase/amino-acid N-acetyltransferase